MKNGVSEAIQLKDGRTLGFAKYGDPVGKPVLYFHGSPGCRLDWSIFGDRAWAERHGVLFLAIDRPGIGSSDFQADRRLRDWPDDVVQLADALGLDRFAVWGYSAGGPYAAVCAWKLAQRLTGAVIVSGLGPFSELPEVYGQIAPGGRRFWTLARDWPFLSRLFLQFVNFTAKRSPERFGEGMAGEMPESDRQYFAEVQSVLAGAIREALRAGPRGTQYDAWLVQQPWGFALREVVMDVHLWHGEADKNVPVRMGRHLAEEMPRCQARFYEGEGHVSLIKKYRDEIVHVLAD